ncbi:hypothetical protein GCM10017687_49520 [Streptomyces echinatus]
MNDVLALKDADIGVAMGSGSEPRGRWPRSCCCDNSFASLPSVVGEGRAGWIGNITRVATLFLVKTVYSVLLALLVVCWQVEYPFLPRQPRPCCPRSPSAFPPSSALAPTRSGRNPTVVRRVMRYAVPAAWWPESGDLRDVSARPAPLLRAGALNAETSAGPPMTPVPDLHVGAGDHRAVPYTWWR